jgi:hypothetical protein
MRTRAYASREMLQNLQFLRQKRRSVPVRRTD